MLEIITNRQQSVSWYVHIWLLGNEQYVNAEDTLLLFFKKNPDRYRPLLSLGRYILSMHNIMPFRRSPLLHAL